MGPTPALKGLNGTSDSEGQFGAKKVEGPSKSRDFVQGDSLTKLDLQSDIIG